MNKVIYISLCAFLFASCNQVNFSSILGGKKTPVNIEEASTTSAHKGKVIIKKAPTIAQKTILKDSASVDSVIAVAPIDSVALKKEISITTKKQLEGEWTIQTMKNRKLSVRDRAFLTFDFKDNRFYGCNGCNVINGEFKASSVNGSIELSNIISTMMECHNGTPEKSVMRTLNEVTNFKISENNGIKYLSLFNAKGVLLFTLKNQDLNFLNGAWTVKELDGEAVTDDNVRLVIDVPELKLHGNSGCNIVNGTLYIDPDKDWAIQFQSLVSTRKMCPNMSVETALLVALEETEYCKEINNDEISLMDGKGNQTVVLRRLELK